MSMLRIIGARRLPPADLQVAIEGLVQRWEAIDPLRLCALYIDEDGRARPFHHGRQSRIAEAVRASGVDRAGRPGAPDVRLRLTNAQRSMCARITLRESPRPGQLAVVAMVELTMGPSGHAAGVVEPVAEVLVNALDLDYAHQEDEGHRRIDAFPHTFDVGRWTYLGRRHDRPLLALGPGMTRMRFHCGSILRVPESSREKVWAQLQMPPIEAGPDPLEQPHSCSEWAGEDTIEDEPTTEVERTAIMALPAEAHSLRATPFDPPYTSQPHTSDEAPDTQRLPSRAVDTPEVSGLRATPFDSPQRYGMAMRMAGEHVR